MKGLDGKRFIIAGGATGIGAATVERLVSEGAHVAIGDINASSARATAERMNEAGGSTFAVEFDFADESSIRDLIKKSVSLLGGVDGIFNVGADLSQETMSRDLDILSMDVAVWRRTMEVNLFGYALSCREVIPYLLERGGGAIVNTSSGGALGGEPMRPAYAASKAGVSALTRHISSRWGREGIRCNAVAPGIVLTEALQRHDISELKKAAEFSLRTLRLGEPEDLAAVATFLLSEDSAYVSGQVWSVNGGWTLRE